MNPVWIIDDDRSIRWVFEKALAREGIAHKTFGAAKEALDRVFLIPGNTAQRNLCCAHSGILSVAVSIVRPTPPCFGARRLSLSKVVGFTLCVVSKTLVVFFPMPFTLLFLCTLSAANFIHSLLL